MLTALAALAALYKPHMSCVVRAPHQPAYKFFSDTTPTPDGLLLVQRNYAPGFSEIIVFAFDVKHRRYTRTQLTDDGRYKAATSPGPVNGTWSWTNIPTSAVPTFPVLHFSRSSGVLRDWYEGTGVAGECH